MVVGAVIALWNGMDEIQPIQPLSLRDTAKGVAIRAGFLSVAGLVIGAWVFGLAAKTASALVKVIVGLLLLTIGAGLAAWEVKKVQRRWEDRS
jgi:ascorbate-specific PTS system EIIC-type component UlaA